MLIGVICEMVLTVGETEREIGTMNFVTEKIEELLAPGGVDENDDNLISKSEFMNMISNKKAASILHEVGVDVVGLIDFADTIFEYEPHEDEEYEKQLTFNEFMRVVLDLRGSKTARVKDIVDLRKHINWRFARLEQKLVDNDVITRSRNSMQGPRLNVSFRNANLRSGPEELCDNSPLPAAGTTAKQFLHVTGSFVREMQLEHEREVAEMHAQNLKLLERLSDASTNADKSIASVLKEAAAAVPHIGEMVTQRNVSNPRELKESPTSEPSTEGTWFWAKPADNDVETTSTWAASLGPNGSASNTRYLRAAAAGVPATRQKTYQT